MHPHARALWESLKPELAFFSDAADAHQKSLDELVELFDENCLTREQLVARCNNADRAHRQLFKRYAVVREGLGTLANDVPSLVSSIETNFLNEVMKNKYSAAWFDALSFFIRFDFNRVPLLPLVEVHADVGKEGADEPAVEGSSEEQVNGEELTEKTGLPFEEYNPKTDGWVLLGESMSGKKVTVDEEEDLMEFN